MENDTEPDGATFDDYRAVWITLQQHHLPLLESHDIIEYDSPHYFRPGPNGQPTIEAAAAVRAEAYCR